MPSSWPQWAEKATRGDIMRVAIKQRAMSLQLYFAISAILQGDMEKAAEKLKNASVVDDEISVLIDELGDRP